MKRKNSDKYSYSEHQLASYWNDPEKLLRTEQQRYPFQRALTGIISSVASQYIPKGAAIYEIGAGQGYLKDLIPKKYHKKYISSDYNLDNLKAGLIRRKLIIEQASALSLLLSSASQECIISMDTYGTLPNIEKALSEVFRVLKPTGRFIHFQVNYPSQDLPSHRHKEHIFFPARRDFSENSIMLGINRKKLKSIILKSKDRKTKEILQLFLHDQKKAINTIWQQSDPKGYTNYVNDVLDTVISDKIAISSLPDYLSDELENAALKSTFKILESSFRNLNIRDLPTNEHRRTPRFNVFSIDNGVIRKYRNDVLAKTNPDCVVEKATIMVFVAEKN